MRTAEEIERVAALLQTAIDETLQTNGYVDICYVTLVAQCDIPGLDRPLGYAANCRPEDVRALLKETLARSRGAVADAGQA